MTAGPGGLNNSAPRPSSPWRANTGVTLAICRSPAPSAAIRRHCLSFSWDNAGGRPTRFPFARARSRPSRSSRWPSPPGRPPGPAWTAERTWPPRSPPGYRCSPAGPRCQCPAGQLRLDAHPVLKRPAEPIQEGHHQSIPRLDMGHQVLPARALEGTPAGDVGKDQLRADAVVGQQPELGGQILGVIVGLADPGVAVGDGVGGHVAMGNSGAGVVDVHKTAFLNTRPEPLVRSTGWCSRTAFNYHCRSTSASRGC